MSLSGPVVWQQAEAHLFHFAPFKVQKQLHLMVLFDTWKSFGGGGGWRARVPWSTMLQALTLFEIALIKRQTKIVDRAMHVSLWNSLPQDAYVYAYFKFKSSP